MLGDSDRRSFAFDEYRREYEGKRERERRAHFAKRVIEHGISHQRFIIGDLRDFDCFDATPERGRR